MPLSSDDLIPSALSLPEQERAGLAMRLLDSLPHPGEEITSEDFGRLLRERVAGFRSGEVESDTLGEARDEIARRFREGTQS